MTKKLGMFRGIALALVWLLAAPVTLAQDVVLNPGYISGSVGVTGQTINSASIYASWTDPATGTNYSASTSLSSAGSYTLTVNVPQGSSPTYTVFANIYMNGYQYYLTPPSQSVGVAAFQTSTADFVVDPGLIEATVNTTSGTLSSVQFYAYGGGGSAYASGSASPLTFPVIPCTTSNCMQVYGYAYFSGGGYAFLDYQYTSVGAGQTAALAWTVSPPPPPAQGTLSGTIALNGASVNQHTIYASGPSSGSASLSADGSFEMPNLNAGSYYLYAYSYFNNYSSYLYHPDASFSPNRNPTVTGGATTAVDISANAAFLQGTLKLTGTKSLSQVSSASLTANGAQQTFSSGGAAGTSPNLQSGAYSLVVTEGGWSPSSLYINFNDYSPSPYLSENLYFFDYQSYYNPIALAAGDTVTRNLTYGTGTVTVNFSVLGGGTLSNPYLQGSCSDYDNQTNQYRSTYSFYSYGNQQNVNPGSVTFVGMAGTCTVEAFAQVGGSFTKFGTLSVTVVPGSSQEVDIGGPVLTLTFPPADYVTSNSSINVTGTATDDVAVASVTVNGQPASLTPEAPAASVGFSAAISLNVGPNQIQTVATDTAGKIASDTRTVYRDDAAPTLSWTPADGSSSPDAAINLAGTANDDAGIQSITVNGIAVSFQSTGNGNEVSFSVPFTLLPGSNFIEVVATDISNKMTAQTHQVTLGVADTTAPVITPSIAGALGANGWYTSDVIVSWSVVDPESPITAMSGCGSTTITTDTAGMTFTCSATSAGGSASKSVTIMRDTSAPVITPTVTGTLGANGWYTSNVVVSWSVADTLSPITTTSGCDSTSITTDTAGTTLTCSATSSGGSASRSVTIKRDTAAPAIAGLPGASCSLWPPNHRLVRVATLTASDLGSGVAGSLQLSVTSNEPINGPGDGNTTPDWVIGSDGSIQLRAERSGPGNGRIYTITASATDAAGNTTTATATCTVPHDQRGR